MIKVYWFKRIICIKKKKNKNMEKLVKIAVCRKKSSCFQGPYKFILIAHIQNFEENADKSKRLRFQMLYSSTQSPYNRK